MIALPNSYGIYSGQAGLYPPTIHETLDPEFTRIGYTELSEGNWKSTSTGVPGWSNDRSLTARNTGKFCFEVIVNGWAFGPSNIMIGLGTDGIFGVQNYQYPGIDTHLNSTYSHEGAFGRKRDGNALEDYGMQYDVPGDTILMEVDFELRTIGCWLRRYYPDGAANFWLGIMYSDIDVSKPLHAMVSKYTNGSLTPDVYVNFGQNPTYIPVHKRFRFWNGSRPVYIPDLLVT